MISRCLFAFVVSFAATSPAFACGYLRYAVTEDERRYACDTSSAPDFTGVLRWRADGQSLPVFLFEGGLFKFKPNGWSRYVTNPEFDGNPAVTLMGRWHHHDGRVTEVHAPSR